MKPTSGKKDWRNTLRPLVQKIEPVTRLAERVANFAVQIQKPMTPLGVVGLASVAVNSLKDLTDHRQPSGWNIDMMVSRSFLIEALKQGGAVVRPPPPNRELDNIQLVLHGESLYICSDGSLTLPAAPSDEFFEWLCQMLDRVLPSVLVIGPGSGNDKYKCTPGKLTSLRSKRGPEIVAATMPLLEGGRSILINGKPGVGKSTMAQEIALVSGLGRTLVLEPGAVGYRKHGELSSSAKNAAPVSANSSASFAMTLKLLRPGVIIVDDVDKINLPLSDLEAMREVAKLVILTCNNGDYDDVLDAAEIRPGRIDEVFNIEPEHAARQPPFDKLSEEDWNIVSQWPVASLNELAKRLRNREEDLNIKDLAERLKRKTRSGDKMY